MSPARRPPRPRPAPAPDSDPAVSPILLEVFKNRFASIAEEMGVTLTHTAFSPNIKERRDLSCAVFDAQGELIAQAAHIPVHLGSMPLSVRAAIAAHPFAPGDMVLLNDPFHGGTHLPDITVVAPVFAPRSGPDGTDIPPAPATPATSAAPAFYVANRAHHADVGGMSAGSMPLSTSLFQEGLILPPVKIIRAGVLDEQLLGLILANVRTPAERRGDFAAQFMANTTGVRRMTELLARHGPTQPARYAAALMDYTETLMRAAIAAMPDGRYPFEDVLDSDGSGRTDIPIRLVLEIAGDTARLDFTASADQVPGSVNAVRAITCSCAFYVFRCLLGRETPANAGCLRPIEVLTRPGSILDARFPAAVAGGNVETSQRIVDVILGALAQALPDRIPAASQGTMNNLAMGNAGAGRNFAYYETLAGGMGGSPRGPGESAVHSHMTNTLNTPIEALEYAYPLRVTRFGVARHTGGPGRHPGGDGLTREIQALAPCELTLLSERRDHAPYGLAGGLPGAPGRNELLRADGQTETVPAKFHTLLAPGDRLRITTPGGGGWGRPREDE
ncbi:MAG: hydantoinase B/oxoprolinase family protein [Desulfovibrionaceae bacterium]